jgi:hypothetical protein
VTTFDTVEALAGALADDLHALIAGAAGPVLIGVPAGRTLRRSSVRWPAGCAARGSTTSYS